MVSLRPPVWLESGSLFFRSPVSKAKSCGDDPLGLEPTITSRTILPGLTVKSHLVKYGLRALSFL